MGKGGWSNNPDKNWSDVWYTKDTKNWKLFKSNICWREWHEPSAFVYDEMINFLNAHDLLILDENNLPANKK